MSQEKFKQFIAHFSKEESKEFKKFVLDGALLYSRYFFVRRLSSTIQRGFCTHCLSNHVVKSNKTLTHNEDWQCEKCKSLVIVKQAGRGRGKMFDKAYVIWYEKSKISPDTITATGYNVSRDYRENMKGETLIEPVARYVFEVGKATMMHRNYYYAGCFNTRVMRFEEGWEFASKPFSMIGKNSFTVHSEQSIESVHDAVKGTPFVYSTWEQYCKNNEDLIPFFATYSKYPFVEYLTKMNMKNIVDCIVEKRDLHKSINYRGKNMNKILGLSKVELKAFKDSGIKMEPINLKTYKWFRDNGAPISWKEAKSCDMLLAGTYYLERLQFIQSLLPLEKIVKYCRSQMNKEPKRHRNITSVLIMWKDYLDECSELKMDISLSKVLLPNSLHKAHQKTMRQIKMKKDEIINQKISNLQPKLKKYCFEQDGLIIRPAASSIELFDEGEQLDHCVGSYAERYSNGETVILFVRRISEPGKSFYTVEVNRNTITQAYGYDNEFPTKEVEKFLNSFKNERLIKTHTERKVAI